MTQAGAKFELARQRAGWGSIELVAEVLAQRLAAADPYLLGEWFTAADVMLGSAADWALDFGVIPTRPEITNYVERIRARPAFQRATPSAPDA